MIQVSKRIIIILIFIFNGSCASGGYVSSNSPGFNPNTCANIPIGIEKLQYLDPAAKHLKMSCADVARCASYTGEDISDIPCE